MRPDEARYRYRRAPMTDAAHILVVDDDREIRSLLSAFLEKNGLRATAVGDGTEARRALTQGRVDLIVLDLMLPRESGLAICRELRATSTIPIIMLTALGEEVDRIVGLEVGADDYLSKPFSPRELLGRIRAVLRRTSLAAPAADAANARAYRFAGWRLDTMTREFDAKYVRMQQPGFDRALRNAFGASPKQLGAAAVKAARKR